MSKVSVFGIGLEPHLMISNSKLNLRDRVPKLVLECVAYIEDQGTTGPSDILTRYFLL